MAIGKIKASRVNNVDADTYIGEDGILFYNYANGVVRISDGITPGGVSVPYTVASNTVIGGIKAGPGVVISNEGELYIDSANLAFSFGNFTANNNILTIVNTDEDMILETSGNAEIQLVGNVGFYRTNGGGVPDPSAKFFTANDDGQITILVPTEDPITGGVEIIGAAGGNFIAPGTAGTMLHLTGNPNVSCRLYQDSIGSYSSFVGRRYNGNVASPTQVLAGQDVLRFNATAATDAGVGNVALAQIAMTALEDQTTTAQGSKITFTVTPIGSPASSRVDVANISVANGVSATKFTTSGNVVANVIVAASAGNINLAGNLIPAANTYTLGTEADPWQSAYFGPESITLLDTTGTTNNTVIIKNATGNITMSTAGFDIQTLGTTNSIFRIEATTGQIYSNANTIIQNTTDSVNTTSGSLQTAGGAGIAKNLYVGGNITANVLQCPLNTNQLELNCANLGYIKLSTSGIGPIQIQHGDSIWSFGNGGLLALPDGASVDSDVLTILANDGDLTLESAGNIVMTANGTANIVQVSSDGVTVTGNITSGNILTAGLISATGNISGGNLAVSGTAAITGNTSAGNLSATNYTGLVTHAIRDAGNVDGGTVTLNMTTDNIVKCTFGTNGMTVAFSNIIPGRIVTLLAEKTDGTTDNINTGIASTNMSNGDNTSPVNGLCTAVLTYYSLGTTTDDIYCQIVSAT